MVNPAHSEVGTKLKIDILGDMYDVTVIPESPYGPENQKTILATGKSVRSFKSLRTQRYILKIILSKKI